VLLQRLHSRIHRKKKNSKADELANAATLNTPLPPDMFFQVVIDVSIMIVEVEIRVINVI
jgi:hypothetical protein